MGQAPIPGFGDKLLVTEMRAQVTDPSAPETITIWLTIPPTKQVVFAVGRLLEYDPHMSPTVTREQSHRPISATSQRRLSAKLLKILTAILASYVAY